MFSCLFAFGRGLLFGNPGRRKADIRRRRSAVRVPKLRRRAERRRPPQSVESRRAPWAPALAPCPSRPLDLANRQWLGPRCPPGSPIWARWRPQVRVRQASMRLTLAGPSAAYRYTKSRPSLIKRCATTIWSRKGLFDVTRGAPRNPRFFMCELSCPLWGSAGESPSSPAGAICAWRQETVVNV